jgi:hypothetical protein
MPHLLLRLAYVNGIIIECYNFNNERLEALYLTEPGCPPIIGVSKRLRSNRAHLRTVLSHELGHHFTSTKSTVGHAFYDYGDKLEIGRDEYRASV